MFTFVVRQNECLEWLLSIQVVPVNDHNRKSTKNKIIRLMSTRGSGWMSRRKELKHTTGMQVIAYFPNNPLNPHY